MRQGGGGMDSAAATGEELRVAATDNTRRGREPQGEGGRKGSNNRKEVWGAQASQTKGSHTTGAGGEGTAQAEDRWATAR